MDHTHMADYSHPCKFGSQCHKMRELSHLRDYFHKCPQERPGEACPFHGKDHDHDSIYVHGDSKSSSSSSSSGSSSVTTTTSSDREVCGPGDWTQLDV